MIKQPTVAVQSELPERELPVGSYVLLVSGGEAENYEFRYENGILVVNKANRPPSPLWAETRRKPMVMLPSP